MGEHIYSKANALANANLSDSHPVTKMMASLTADRAEKDRQQASASHVGTVRRLGSKQPGSKQVNPSALLLKRQYSDTSNFGESPALSPTSSLPVIAGVAGSGGAVAREVGSSSSAPQLSATADESSQLGSKRPSDAGDAVGPTLSASSRKAKKPVPGKVKKKNDQPDRPKDIFRGFLDDVIAEMDAKRSSFFDRQEDQRKRLIQNRRLTSFQLKDQQNDDDLKDKRYTGDGHKVMMVTMTKENMCRSDPELVKGARKFGGSPEAQQMKKLNALLFVRPPTPPPQPAARKTAMDESLAALMAEPQSADDGD